MGIQSRPTHKNNVSLLASVVQWRTFNIHENFMFFTLGKKIISERFFGKDKMAVRWRHCKNLPLEALFLRVYLIHPILKVRYTQICCTDKCPVAFHICMKQLRPAHTTLLVIVNASKCSCAGDEYIWLSIPPDLPDDPFSLLQSPGSLQLLRWSKHVHTLNGSI